MTIEQWRQWALELACGGQVRYHVRYLGLSARGHHIYHVQTQENRQGRLDALALVRYDATRGTVACACSSGRYGAACGHAGAVLAYQRASELMR